MSARRSLGVLARKPSSSIPARPIALSVFETLLFDAIPLRPITRSSQTQTDFPSWVTTRGPRSAWARGSRDSHTSDGTAERSRWSSHE